MSELFLFGAVFFLGLIVGWMFGFGIGHAQGKAVVSRSETPVMDGSQSEPSTLEVLEDDE